jgi:hypothetical protein
VTLAGPCRHAACGRAGQASCQPRACFASNGKSVVPCRRPATRPVTTGGISVRVSSLARARSSHRANTNCRKPAPAASAARAETKTAWHPQPRHQNAFPLHPLKSVLVSRPLAGLFSILHARALFPPRSVPNCKQTGLGDGGAFAPPNSFDQESQNCPTQGGPTAAEAHPRIFKSSL